MTLRGRSVLEVLEKPIQKGVGTPNPWEYFMKTRIKAHLKPKFFGGVYPQKSTQNNDMLATLKPSEGVPKIYDLGLNRGKWSQKGTLMDSFDGCQIDIALVKQKVTATYYERAPDWLQFIANF